jgi:ATP-binding cassette subfamily C (CFTR/MRP) protein 4
MDPPACPLGTASLPSRIVFSWVSQLFASRGALAPRDLWRLLPEDTPGYHSARLAAAWRAELAASRAAQPPRAPSLAAAFWAAFSGHYLSQSVFIVVKGAFVLGQVQCLALLLSALQVSATAATAADGSGGGGSGGGGGDNAIAAYGYAAGMVACAIVAGMLHHVFFFEAWRGGMRWRAAASALIFEKALTLRLDALAAVSAGRVVNLMTNDVERFSKLAQMAAYLVVAPLEAAVIVWLLWREDAAATFAGAAALLLFLGVQTLFSRSFGRLRAATAPLTDARVKAAAQAIGGMRVIKLMSWERAFAASVAALREREVALVRSASILRGLNEAIFGMSPVVVGAATFFTVYALGDIALTPRLVFVTLSLFSFLQVELTKFFPQALEGLAEARVSVLRIQALLLLPEAGAIGASAGAEADGGGGADDTAASGTAAPAAVQVAVGAPGAAESGRAGVPQAITSSGVPPAIDVSSFSCSWGEAIVDPSVAVMAGGSGGGAPAALGSPVSAVASPLAAAARAALSGISLRVECGTLCAIVGVVGAGKSSLLLALLHELGADAGASGGLCVRGRVAYAPQSPWILSASVRDNVLAGRPRDDARLGAVLRACALDEDIARLPEGLDTFIGEKGVNLSGGQRARVGLARACYDESAQVVLLDDVFSAVDARVGAQIFERLLVGPAALLRGRTRVLVTHQMRYARPADQVVVLGVGGCIVAQGSMNELRVRAAAGDEALSEIFHDEDKEGDKGGHRDVNGHSSVGRGLVEPAAAMVDPPTPVVAAATPTSAGSLVKAEASQEGGVRLSTLLRYCAGAGSSADVAFVVLLMMLGAGTFIASSAVLALWAGLAPALQHGSRLVPVYGALVAGALVLSLWRSAAFFSASVAASERVHNAAFRRVLCMPIAFFDANPSGRILNRLSKDVGVCDDFLPYTSFDFLSTTLLCVCIVLLVVAVAPWVLLAAAPLIVASMRLRSYYMMTARTVKRLESTSRSPVLSLTAEALNGLPVLRSLRLQSRLTADFHAASDANVRAYFAFISTNRWLGVRLDALCFLLLIASTVASVALRGTISPALIGLSLSSVLSVTNAFQWAVRQSGELESSLISVERLMEYVDLPGIEKIDLALEDAPAASADSPTAAAAAAALDAFWPSAGALSLRGVTLQYRAGLAPALSGISFEVPAGSRVGVVGRTGAGKSSLFLALLRLVEPTCEGGGSGVLLDGVDTASVPLSRLRRAVSVVAQEPVLYAGSLRNNLDPFREHSDAAVLGALEAVQLTRLLGGGLDAPNVEEGGGNLSVGERQLLCLARAVLRRNKLLLLDEATANVDAETDRRIQGAVRTLFRGCTILTVAHRLETVADYDLVVELEAGRVKRVGRPSDVIVNGRLRDV